MQLGTEDHKISCNPTNYIFTGVKFFFSFFLIWKYSQCINLRKNTNIRRREVNHVKLYQPAPTVINTSVSISSWTLPIYTLLINLHIGLINIGLWIPTWMTLHYPTFAHWFHHVAGGDNAYAFQTQTQKMSLIKGQHI